MIVIWTTEIYTNISTEMQPKSDKYQLVILFDIIGIMCSKEFQYFWFSWKKIFLLF